MNLLRQLLLGLISILIAVAVGFIWHEGKNETQFLCGNFKKGDSKTSVVGQLDTAHLAYYETEPRSQGQTVVFQSVIGFAPKCIIDFDENEQVTKVHLQ